MEIKVCPLNSLRPVQAMRNIQREKDTSHHEKETDIGGKRWEKKDNSRKNPDQSDRG